MSFLFPPNPGLPPESAPWITSSTQMFCGKCNHPMHWKECGAGANLTAPCDCRNDVSTYDPDPRYVPDVEDGSAARRCAVCSLDRHDEIHALSHPDHHPWWNPAYPVPRSSSKAWLLLALGVGAALGFVAGWVAR